MNLDGPGVLSMENLQEQAHCTSELGHLGTIAGLLGLRVTCFIVFAVCVHSCSQVLY